MLLSGSSTTQGVHHPRRRALVDTNGSRYRTSARISQPVPAHGAVPAQVQEVAAGAWHSLSPSIWQGTEADALSTSNPYFQSLAPPWKVLLLSDGSVTRHLQLMTGEAVKAECLEMVNVGSATAGLPPGVDQIPGPRVQRQVLLRPVRANNNNSVASMQQQQTCSGQHLPQLQSQPLGHTSGTSNGSVQPQPLVYACSWWAAAEVDEFLKDRSQTIWASLSQGHVELYREIQSVYYGHNAYLEELLGMEGPLWGRQYFFWHQGRPLTLIYEVFSPHLAKYLGPVQSS